MLGLKNFLMKKYLYTMDNTALSYIYFTLWPVYTVPFSCEDGTEMLRFGLPCTLYPASNEDCCIRKYLSAYTMPFLYDNISIPFSYENGALVPE